MYLNCKSELKDLALEFIGSNRSGKVWFDRWYTFNDDKPATAHDPWKPSRTSYMLIYRQVYKHPGMSKPERKDFDLTTTKTFLSKLLGDNLNARGNLDKPFYYCSPKTVAESFATKKESFDRIAAQITVTKTMKAEIVDEMHKMWETSMKGMQEIEERMKAIEAGQTKIVDLLTTIANKGAASRSCPSNIYFYIMLCCISYLTIDIPTHQFQETQDGIRNHRIIDVTR